ncbi:hypothetical protein B0A55_13030 [Friedmanniomyces simplex]|uniref:EthD domain-containing protein n=1 Tax=Friedmanniomyces simplex TaxID=329884 RepID=A0A4U0W2M3_9PEZI|nr:hypothetical protein B0A55_13030 [Friedmanniomyces simplex]
MSATAIASSHGVLTQNLLKRRAGSTIEEFRKHYIERHGKLAIPWFLANGVTYYAQTHRPLHWATDAARQKYESAIYLSDWDAVGEVAFAPGYGSFSNAQAYYQEVILPDERRFLLDEAFKHMKVVDAESVAGEVVEFIVDGKAVVEYEEWRGVFGGYEKR